MKKSRKCGMQQSTAATAPVGEFGDIKRDKMIEAVSEDAPMRVGIFRRVYAGKSSPRTAIKAKCLECCWMDTAAIRDCTATECPLYDFRPYQVKAVRT